MWHTTHCQASHTHTSSYCKLGKLWEMLGLFGLRDHWAVYKDVINVHVQDIHFVFHFWFVHHYKMENVSPTIHFKRSSKWLKVASVFSFNVVIQLKRRNSLDLLTDFVFFHRYFHHRKQSRPKVGPWSLVVWPLFLVAVTDRGSLWSWCLSVVHRRGRDGKM